MVLEGLPLKLPMIESLVSNPLPCGSWGVFPHPHLGAPLSSRVRSTWANIVV